MPLFVLISMFILPLQTACHGPEVHPDFSMQDLKAGQGEQQVGRFDTVMVRYTGRFENGKVFDSSQGKTRQYSMRSPTLIDGWKVGLIGMRVGGQRRLKIPPEMAYGQKGKFGRIPPDTTLIFDVELVEIK